MKTYRSGQVILFMAGLILTLALSVAALADFTVGKPMYESFQMFNAGGSPRTNCDLSKFTATTWKDNLRTALAWTFKNQSTGDYTATANPASAGFYKADIYYNNTAIGTFNDMVRLYDIDTMYASSGPRFADISSNLSSAATAFVAVRTTLNNVTGFIHNTNTTVAVIPTDPELSTDPRLTYLDAYISTIPTNPLLSGDSRLNNLDAAISSRMSNANWTVELPTFNDISAGVHGLKSAVQSVPTNPLLATDSRLNNLPSASTIASTIWDNGTRTLTSGNAYVNTTSIDEYLSAKHGTGAWNAAGNVTVLPFQGAASYETVGQGKDVHVTRGDSVSIPYSIGKDLTGWTVWFGAKATPADTTYALAPRDITTYVTYPSTGSGLINLSTADTDLPVRKYAAEVEIRNGTDVNTVLKFNLLIDAGVLN